MLVFGSFNTSLLYYYPDTRFVWGPNSLQCFIGSDLMIALMDNVRFRTISIFRIHELEDILLQKDSNYKQINVVDGNKKKIKQRNMDA